MNGKAGLGRSSTRRAGDGLPLSDLRADRSQPRIPSTWRLGERRCSCVRGAGGLPGPGTLNPAAPAVRPGGGADRARGTPAPPRPPLQLGLRPYPGEGQSRGSIRGRSLASSSAESVTLGRCPEPSDSSSSPDWLDSPDSGESSASRKSSSGMSSSSCSVLGEGLTICGRDPDPGGQCARASRRACAGAGVYAAVNLKP